MNEPSVDELRRRLRELGYLSHGIERWFALDPWSSRTFWTELLLVALKAAVLISPLGALTMTGIMLLRNGPLAFGEAAMLAAMYGAALLGLSFLFIVVVALLLKLRPALAIDTSRGLLIISVIASAFLTSATGVWWWGFEQRPGSLETLIGISAMVIFFLVATIVISAALLSFSIYELRRIPVIHQRSRLVPVGLAAVILAVLLFGAIYSRGESADAKAPPQVLTTQTSQRLILIAVDGLTFELLAARPRLTAAFRTVLPAAMIGGASATERWATIGTGTPGTLHGVHTVEALQLSGGNDLLQSVSRNDVVLRALGESTGLTRGRALPPTARRRDYVWELFAARGIHSAAVNWWTSVQSSDGALESTPQEIVFAAASDLNGDRHVGASPAARALAIDHVAETEARRKLEVSQPQFATVYLPALDIIQNRLGLDPTDRLAWSQRALEQLESIVTDAGPTGAAVLLIGMPGDGQKGRPVIAFSGVLESTGTPTPLDIAPTACDLLGFPASAEMSGHSLIPRSRQQRIASYGRRGSYGPAGVINEEYYRTLKSLGYVR